MASSVNPDGPRPSYVVSADPISRPLGINFDAIKLDLSHEFSLVASSTETSSLEPKDYLQVYLRVRPFTQSEKEQESQGCVHSLDSQTIVLKDPQGIPGRLSERSSAQMAQKFSFSKVFGPETTQKEFFQDCALQPIKDLLKGESRLIFTYGLTNSGKTYTFQGTEDSAGILPRTLNVLFDALRERLYTKMNLKPHRSREYLRLSPGQEKEEATSKSALLRQIREVMPNDSYDTLHGSLANSLSTSELEEFVKDHEQACLNTDDRVKFSVWVSFFEIYNECIYDLFVPVSSKLLKRRVLRLSQDVKGYSFIKDLQWVQVCDSREAYKLLKLGVKNQSVAFTKLNSASSRSHSIFTVRILQIEDSELPRVVRVSELSLCDLAGSERSVKTQNEGERLRETGSINASLLTLGKCIGALKSSEKSKFQHVPFRESKLTHYFQSFFNGKGKISMIVNISQCCLAYDETLNVLKFSAIAQKVCLPESLNSSQEKSFGPIRASQHGSQDASSSRRKGSDVQRSATAWESSLEDLLEDEDPVGDLERPEGKPSTETELTEDDLDETVEEAAASASREEKRKLLDLIQDLKEKLINERKEKLTLELKIREEVTEEFSQYLAQREADFKETLLQERERLEENADCRLAIFRDLVGKAGAQEAPAGEERAVTVETGEAPNYIAIEDIIDSLHDDVTDIKKQAEIAHLCIASLADPQEPAAALELKLNQVQTELVKTKEELIKTQEELKKRQKESEMSGHSLTQELEECNEDKADTAPITENEPTCPKSAVVAVAGPQGREARSHSGRKRLNEGEPGEEEPPAKKGPLCGMPAVPGDRKKSDQVQQSLSEGQGSGRVFLGKNDTLERHLAALEKELEAEREAKAELKAQAAALQQKLVCSEERSSALTLALQQARSDFDSAESELRVQRNEAREREEALARLAEETEAARRNITNHVSQIKFMQAKIDELRALDPATQLARIDLLHLGDLPRAAQDGHVPRPQCDLAKEESVVRKQVPDGAHEVSRENSFHASIEAIWEECKEIVKTSSQRSHQIQGLEQRLETVQAQLQDALDENRRLAVEETERAAQGDLLRERESQIRQLTAELGAQAQLAAAGQTALSELAQDAASLRQRITELEAAAETQREECRHAARLEREASEKAAVILKLERSLSECRENLEESVRAAKEGQEREGRLDREVSRLTSELQGAKQSLQLKEAAAAASRRDLERVQAELAASTALAERVKADLQRREDEYADLKEKLADAKKQIEQVQKEVSVMRDEEKLLRVKVNELEKKKNQCSQELDLKQRAIQQLKEQLNGQKAEEAIQQLEQVRQALSAKEKIIEDMRMTLEEQEQTQAEQDRALEAKAEEAERLATELEKLKERCRELEARARHRCDQELEARARHRCDQELEGGDHAPSRLRQLRDELQASEQRHTADRRKWLEERTMLVAQAKEAESLRNKEMKKFAEDRERCLKQQSELETLAAQLTEKDRDLRKWREERDQLVAALEVQLQALISRNAQKDREIEQLKRAAENPAKDTQTEDSKLRHKVETEPHSASGEMSSRDVEGASGVRDSGEVSTEHNPTTRFPKPELEIQFTPLRPNVMAVRHPGCSSPVTVRLAKARKRKSSELEENLVKCENKKNATPRADQKSPFPEYKTSLKKEQQLSSKKTYSLRSQASNASIGSAAKKKEGTLQKLGDFLQHSPTILQSKAKKIIETMSASKPSAVEACKENVSQPKRAKRRLHTREISSPIDISGHVIVMDQKVKESDHEILKRRLRAKMAK